MAKAEPTFEQAIEQLEAIVERIESGEVGLEEAIKQYEQGAALVKRCRSILGAAEKKIAELKVEDVAEQAPDDTDALAESADDDEAPF